MTAAARRQLATRRALWARGLARRLAQHGVRPNAVSLVGVGFALAAGAAFGGSADCGQPWRTALLLGAAACIQLRLLCNLLDGMLAVEEGLKTKTGEIFNELPDRIADVLILIGAGYATGTPALGWAAALAAVLTAYVRVFGGSLGLTQHFIGPMAKQHRMFLLTLVTLLAVAEGLNDRPGRAIPAGLVVIIAGSIVTTVRRTRRILTEAGTR